MATWALRLSSKTLNRAARFVDHLRMTVTESVTAALAELATEEKRLFLPRFFKTGKGQYGEGDQFLGVVVPDTRKVAKVFRDAATPEDLDGLLDSAYHEVRLCGLLIMVARYPRASEAERQQLFDFYLSHTDRINNWDLVDLTAPAIVGTHLLHRSREVLYRLADSPLLWDNRIAMVSTLTFIRAGEQKDTYALATKLMRHPHDLMHKAVGWMLREAGKRDPRRLYDYVEHYRLDMPRTLLRYAIEKFSPDERAQFMRR